MIANYYTLRHVALDLQRRWTGHVMTSFFSQERNELALMTDGDEALLLSCEPSANSLYLRTGFSRAKKNTVEIFPDASGHVLRFVSIHSSDREITLGLDNDVRIILQLYGSKANAFLVDLNRLVLDSFLRSRELKGKSLDLQSEHPSPPDSVEQFASVLSQDKSLPVSTACKRINPLLGGVLTRELLFRSGLDEQTPVVEIDDDALKRLFAESQSLLGELTGDSAPCIYYRGDIPVTFSIIPLRHLEQTRMESFDSIHKAIQTFLSTSRRERIVRDEREWVTEKLEKEKAKVERTLAKARSETATAERADGFELAGKLLMASLHQISKGATSIMLENVFSPENEPIEIQLDVHSSPVKNAERYFEKARKARHSIEEQRERLREMVQQLAGLRELLDGIGRIETTDDWKEFAGSHRDALREAGVVVKAGSVKEEEKVPFRVFVVEAGFQVWAGKSSENNDLLTLKYAKPNDLWFHARGAGGSHVVLRLGTGKGEVSRRAMEQAASIAAYYSKMKNAGLVPVAMTTKKYVRKPKGAPAGTVAIERERVLMVPPRLPDSHSQ